MEKNLFRKIPKVDKILDDPKIIESLNSYGKNVVKHFVDEVLSEIKADISNGNIKTIDETNIINEIVTEVLFKTERFFSPKLKKVINGTGIVLHTNFGRAPLSENVLKNISEIAGNYSNLEYNIEKGERGIRYQNIIDYFKYITGCEDVLVVNNNAAAVLLILSALGKDREVIISRGELIEIGGSFRIPDVMEQSGAILREVGATNKTNINDYINAINEETAIILKAHTSNYRIIGFTKSVEIEDLVRLGKERDIPVVFDLGSGSLVDLSNVGLPDEPVIKDILKKDVDIVTFSGDKLLGGPQAGIILGKKKYIEKLKKHPLNRALRIDKFTLAALESVIKEYLNEDRVFENVLSLALIKQDLKNLRKRALKIRRELRKHTKLKVNIKDDFSFVGGGAFPMHKIKTVVIELIHNDFSASKIDGLLRKADIPIIGRIKNDIYMLDIRTIFDSQVKELTNVILSKI